MSDLEDFVKNNAPSGKKSKLDAFAGEIFTLKNLGYSEKDILRFLLEKKGIKVSQPTLNRFIRSQIGKTIITSETNHQPINDSVQVRNRQVSTVTPTVPVPQKTNSEKSQRPIIGKFDPNSEIDVNELM
ncbi:hypothetical protein [Neisseria sicca]|jgi:hypothetical protein|uniref:hypothetical protein n=1 Tax=Neisseria sicca TaxID=490 RepID=UPI0011BD1B50|nr:hypothetical protein [Neisseria sicca]